MKILVIEDDQRAAAFLKTGLMASGFVVDVCEDGADGFEWAVSGQHDAIVLDVTLPGRDGWSILTELRQRDVVTPVLMLTAQDAIEHRVRGLSLGADDYLVKPFAFSELVARIRSLLRRGGRSKQAEARVEDLILDHKRHLAMRAGKAIDLSLKEFQLLYLLATHRDEVLSRTFISERVWDMNFDSDSNVIEVMIRRLRKKVDEPFSRNLIHTVRGIGYVIR